MTVSAPAGLSEPSTAGAEKSITRLIVATSIGNAPEWYDITVYGYFASMFRGRSSRTTTRVTLFGGMGPATMTWLGGFAPIGTLAPGYYLTAVAILSLGTLLTIQVTRAAPRQQK